MNLTDVIGTLAAVFKEKNVSAVLIGGFAVNFHRYARQTDDIDFMVLIEDFEKMLPALEKKGYRIFTKHENFVRLENQALPAFKVDFLFVDKETMSGIVREAKNAQIAGADFLVPSLSHLIAMKFHSIKQNPSLREGKDLLDIVSLMRANNLDFYSKNFQELCRKYGSEDTYRKLQLFFGEKHG